MKVEIKEKEEGFKPIKLEITIESKEELYELWHRLNESMSVIYENSTKKYPCDENWRGTFGLWNAINNLLIR